MITLTNLRQTRRQQRRLPMRTSRFASIHLILVALVLAAFFVVTRQAVRSFEASFSADVVSWLTNVQAVSLAKVNPADPQAPYRILVLRDNRVPLIASVTQSCSSVPSIMALIAAGALLPGRPERRLLATSAVSVIALGANLVRIVLCLWVAGQTGTGAGILFHDYVGILFALCSSLFGLVTLTGLLLPRGKRGRRTLKLRTRFARISQG